MKGRYTCNELKKIRKQIADANGIEYEVTECNYEGDCSGTCPKCESELRYIENELINRQRSGKSVFLAGLAAGVTLFSVAGCDVFTTEGDERFTLEGVPAMPYDTTACNPADSTNCNPAASTGTLDGVFMLEGDVAAPANPEGLE